MKKVQLIRESGVSIIQLNRPETYNALDIEALEQLEAIIKEVKNNEDKIVIITGEGKAFCAGGDVSMMATLKDVDLFDDLMNAITNIVTTLYFMPKIVISAVNGSAAGLGMSLALNADYVVANKDAKFGMLFGGIGLIPDGGAHFFLQQRVGTEKAKQFIWSLEQMNAEEAKQAGYVDVLSEEDAFVAAKILASKLSQGPIQAFLKTKEILHTQNKQQLEEILLLEKEGQLKASQSKDHREGVRAFLEKRKPQFQGK